MTHNSSKKNGKKTAKEKSEEWGIIYERKRKLFEDYTFKLKNLIKELLEKKGLDFDKIEYRTKTVESFIEKIRRKDKDYTNPLNEITDLVGIRIITYYQEVIDEIGEIINSEFEVDWENSVDKAQTLDPDRFGYLSVSFIVSLSPSRGGLSEWEDFKDIKAEIQVRTVLQHAWAVIDHKIRYKKAREVPRGLRRRLFRLSALLEIADDEFSILRKLTEETEEYYLQEIEKGKLNIELNLSSLLKYLTSKNHHIKWMRTAVNIGFLPFEGNIEDQEDLGRLHEILYLLKIKTIGELDRILKDASKWGEKFLATFINSYLEVESESLEAIPSYIIAIIAIYAKKEIVNDEFFEKIFFGKKIKNYLKKLIDN